MQNVMRLWLCTTMLLGLIRCSGASSTTEAALTGVVRTEGADSKIVAEAVIVASNMSAPVVTGLDGQFTLAKSKIGESVVVQITATGYAPQTRYVNSTGTDHDVLNVALRPLQSGDVSLAAAGGGPVTFGIGSADAGVTVSIPAQSLVDSAGNVAQGNVTVNLAYWNYADYKSSGPLPMMAQAANPCDAPSVLTTYGMAEVSVTQNGQELSVAPGHTLGLTFAIPAYQQTLVANLVQSGQLAPRFYSGDHNQGLWIEEGNLDNGILTYDTNAMTMTGQMAHLSTWNLDNSYANVGGCVSGTIVGADGTTPTANQDVRVYFLSRDEVSYFVAKTDINGSYCVNTGVNVQDTTVSYYVSSNVSVDQSNMCNPMPSTCSSLDFGGAWSNATNPNNEAQFCRTCALRNDAICSDGQNNDINGKIDNVGCNPRPSCAAQSSNADLVNNCPLRYPNQDVVLYGYTDSCSPQTPTVDIQMCHFCPGTPLPASCNYIDIRDNNKPKSGGTPTSGGCGDLGVTSFVPGTTIPKVKAVCDPTSANTKYVGQACAAGVDACCPITANLTCQDLLCVPAKDGTQN